VLGNLVRALELVNEAWRDGTDPELRYYLRRLTRWIAPQLQGHHEPSQLPVRLGLPEELARLVSTNTSTGSTEALVGSVETVLLDADESGEAFVVRLTVTESPDAASLAGGTAFSQALDRARQAVFRLIVARGEFRPETRLLRASGFELDAAMTHRLEGGSIAAAAAVALFSRWTGLAVPAGVVVTGCLGSRGEMLPVAGVEAKRSAVARERPAGSTRLLLPEGQQGPTPGRGPRESGATSLEQLLREVFGEEAASQAASAVDIEGTVRLGIELYEKEGRFGLAHEVMQTALDAIEQRRGGEGESWRVEEFLALWRAGSSLIHLGHMRQARRLMERARVLGHSLWQAGEVDPRAYLGFRGNLAVLLRDQLELEAAEAVLLDNLEQQRALRQDRREVAKTLGNLGEVWTFLGQWERAEQALQQALEALRSVYPDEVPRELCYLGNLHLARGDSLLACACYEEGLEANRDVSYGARRSEAFLRYGLCRAHLALDQPEQCVGHASRALRLLDSTELYPRQMILKVQGLARLALGQLQQGEEDLMAAADLTFASGPLARFAAGTALGELAVAVLDGRLESGAGRAVELARSFHALGGELLQRLTPWDVPGDHAALRQTLRAVLDRFPY